MPGSGWPLRHIGTLDGTGWQERKKEEVYLMAAKDRSSL